MKFPIAVLCVVLFLLVGGAKVRHPVGPSQMVAVELDDNIVLDVASQGRVVVRVTKPNGVSPRSIRLVGMTWE